MKIISVVGARPNFMKIAPIHKAIQLHNKKIAADSPVSHHTSNITHLLCHTGQHFDFNMSKVFFDELGLPEPDFYLGVGSGSHAQQTAGIMIEFEKILLNEKPDLVIVVGDVNSTIACSLTACKLNIKVAHIEAGLRSFDRSMPEEINRILTDSISDYLFVTEKSGIDNLKREGIPDEKVFFVGNVMIDSLINLLPKADESGILSSLGLTKENYIAATIHRPHNVDFKEKLSEIIGMLNRLAEKRKIVFPVHPRTKKSMDNFGLMKNIHNNVILTDPLGYIDFISLIKNSELIITDSGGIQEESTFLGKQCITCRPTTERPVTVETGTNHLVGDDFRTAEITANEILSGKIKHGVIPPLWDGKASERIVEIIINSFAH